MQAIFSTGNRGRGRATARFASYDFGDDGGRPEGFAGSRGLGKKRGIGSRFRFYKIFIVALLAGIMLTTVVGVSDVSLSSLHHSDSGTSRAGTSPPVKTFKTITPSFFVVSDVAEAVVQSNQSYNGTIGTGADDFIVVQIAYSQGSTGNLPDISNVMDTQSDVYSRAASASPGVAENFWEQVWTGRTSSTTNSTGITVRPDWLGCRMPCVNSIIIAMTVGRYRGVAEVGASTDVALSVSSSSQSANVTATHADSLLVELLSHGAYTGCGVDAPQPGSGQRSRNCFTATTERTELFDRSVSSAQTYTESYTWSQVEVQRGIYLELEGYRIQV